MPVRRGFNVVISGLPRSGKTTAVKEFVRLHPREVLGFYTEELLEGGVRVGFLLVTTWGESSVFSHVEIRSPHRVSRYGVDLGVLEEAISQVERRWSGEVVVVDEIGKMELMSPRFREFARWLADGGADFLVTVPERSRDPLVLRFKRGFSLLELRRGHVQEVVGELERMFSSRRV